jgi:hypothetical protein
MTIITLAEFAQLTAAGIALGWLLTDENALLFAPAEWARKRLARRHSTVSRYIGKLLSCAVCIGFWPQLALARYFAPDGDTVELLTVAAGALVVHVAWQLVAGALIAARLR